MDFIFEKIRVNVDKLSTLCEKKLYDIDFDIYPCDGYKEGTTPPSLDDPAWRRFNKGERVGGAEGIDGHSWLHFVIEPIASDVYPEMPAKEPVFYLRTGVSGWDALNPQCTVYMNGKTIQALDVNHIWVPLEFGKKYDTYIYLYNGMNGALFDLLPSVFIRDLAVYGLYYDLKVPFEAMKVIGSAKDDFRIIRDSLDKALMLLDLRYVGSEEFYASVKAVSDYLADEFYGKLCGKTDLMVNCIGHTHIDVAWLWTVAQTREKAERSFSTVLSIMDRYPEYKFMSSQPQLYQHVKEANPELYERIKEKIAEGRWEVEGAMWLEADNNLISGESMVRQILYGKRFMKEEFGVDSKILWLPDVFGYSAALPQILLKSGVDKFFTSKISWNEYNSMPHDTFLWKGIDGSEIFTHFISTYVMLLDADRMNKCWAYYKDKSFTNNVLATVGYGDGGGGTTHEMLENYQRLKHGIPGLPKVKMGFAGDFLNDLEKDFYKNTSELRYLPKWDGELYLEMHRGTYTSIAKNKKNNRKSELLYQTAETLSVTDMALLGGEYESDTFRENQTNILLNQFHDIIPGSSIKEVYDDTDVEYAKILADGERICREKLGAIASNLDTEGGILVYNPTSYEVSDFVSVDGKTYYAEKVPAHGYRVIADRPADYGVSVSDKTIENDLIKVTFDDKYRIVSVYDKEEGREVIESGKCANRLEVYEDYPREYDAWEITHYYKQKMWECDDLQSAEPIENGFKVTRNYKTSKIVQEIKLKKGSKRIDFETYIDWHEDHVLLKAAFPVDIRTTRATYDIQFGSIERPTHMNTSWDEAKFEVCAHKWGDISEEGYGVSLLNDCKYGYSAYENTISLSLLKAATYPNPEADRGEHRFTYSLYPHAGDFKSAGTVKEGYLLNMPLTAVPVSANKGKLAESFSLVSCDCENVVVETVKKAEADDSIIVRLYDSFNKKSNATLTFGVDFKKAYLCDLMENEISEIETDGRSVKLPVKNFEIVTVKLSK